MGCAPALACHFFMPHQPPHIPRLVNPPYLLASPRKHRPTVFIEIIQRVGCVKRLAPGEVAQGEALGHEAVSKMAPLRAALEQVGLHVGQPRGKVQRDCAGVGWGQWGSQQHGAPEGGARAGEARSLHPWHWACAWLFMAVYVCAHEGCVQCDTTLDKRMLDGASSTAPLLFLAGGPAGGCSGSSIAGCTRRPRSGGGGNGGVGAGIGLWRLWQGQFQ